MTSRTNTIDLSVIHRRHRCPTNRRVTGITLIRGIDMRAGRFAGGNRTIVATLASAQHFIVIHDAYWSPSCTRMTGLTNCTGADMRR